MTSFYQSEVWWAQTHWGYQQIVPMGHSELMRTLLAYRLARIARYAGGEDLDPSEVSDAIQAVLEHLFARVPGVFEAPRAFWETPVGWMILQARLRVQGDALITLSEAAALSGKSISALSGMVRRGTLTSYQDFTEPNPRRRTRVLRREIEALRAKARPGA